MAGGVWTQGVCCVGAATGDGEGVGAAWTDWGAISWDTWRREGLGEVQRSIVIACSRDIEEKLGLILASGIENLGGEIPRWFTVLTLTESSESGKVLNSRDSFS